MQIQVGDIPIHYEEFGDGRPIIVLHGRPSDRAYSIENYEPALAGRSHWRRIYPDMPGMGETPGNDSIETLDDYLAVMVEFVDAATAGHPFAVAGISWGAVIARGIVHERLDRIVGLHLAQPRVDFGPSPAPPLSVIADDLETVASITEDDEGWRQVYVVRSPETLESFRSSVKPGFVSADMDFLRRVSEQAGFSFDLDEPPLPSPTLILAGRQDALVGYRRAIEILEQYPRATLAVLDRAGHALDVEQKGLFAALVNEWLDRVEEWAETTPRPPPG